MFKSKSTAFKEKFHSQKTRSVIFATCVCVQTLTLSLLLVLLYYPYFWFTQHTLSSPGRWAEHLQQSTKWLLVSGCQLTEKSQKTCRGTNADSRLFTVNFLQQTGLWCGQFFPAVRSHNGISFCNSIVILFVCLCTGNGLFLQPPTVYCLEFWFMSKGDQISKEDT